jgi:hypothetical protein
MELAFILCSMNLNNSAAYYNLRELYTPHLNSTFQELCKEYLIHYIKLYNYNYLNYLRGLMVTHFGYLQEVTQVRGSVLKYIYTR